MNSPIDLYASWLLIALLIAFVISTIDRRRRQTDLDRRALELEQHSMEYRQREVECKENKFNLMHDRWTRELEAIHDEEDRRREFFKFLGTLGPSLITAATTLLGQPAQGCGCKGNATPPPPPPRSAPSPEPQSG